MSLRELNDVPRPTYRRSAYVSFSIYTVRSMLMNGASVPIQFGLTGLGGYAGYVCDRLLAESDSDGKGSARLVGVAEPEPERFPRRLKDLSERGIPVVRDFADLLSQPID